jgi:translation initiation factor 2 alpha subunit (eIF-2alpha)
VGTEEVVCVLRSDAVKGTVDVSKRRVDISVFCFVLLRISL